MGTMSEELPPWAHRDGDTVYVESTSDAFAVLDYLTDDEYIVINNRRDSKRVAKAVRKFYLG